MTDDARMVFQESKALIQEMSNHLAGNMTKVKIGFKSNAQIIHDLFDAAAAVALIAQVKNKTEIDHLNELCDHSIEGMHLVQAGEEEEVSADPQ